MDLSIPESVVKAVQARGGITSEVLKERTWHVLNVDHRSLTPKEIEKIREACDRVAASREVKSLIRKITSLKHLGQGKKFVKLDLLADEMRSLVCQLPHRWLYFENKEAEQSEPYLISSISYHPPSKSSREYHPAYISLDGIAFERGHEKNISKTLRRENLQDGATGWEAIALMGFTPETPELNKTHQEFCDKYETLRDKTGKQMIAEGLGINPTTNDGADDRGLWWSRNTIRFDRDGQVGRVIIDDGSGWGEDQRAVADNELMNRNNSLRDNDDVEIKVTNLPLHPYVRVFDMRNHVFCKTHINNINEYIYDRRAFDRVILPEDDKTMIDALVMSERVGDDIMAGKGKGVIVLSSGPAGVGKTLTAEAYAERAKKPLYNIQCSQLGLSAEELEKQLSVALNRAIRWGAILLLDEADVYIRARGDDLNQNAIVGVFLRLLEYFTGVLFMTTNRSTLVDDAVLSRCVVHVRYKLPDAASSLKIWKVLWEQFIGEMTAEELKGLTLIRDSFPNISGRTIKQLIRLGKTMSERLKKPLDLALIKWVARYQDIEEAGNGILLRKKE